MLLISEAKGICSFCPSCFQSLFPGDRVTVLSYTGAASVTVFEQLWHGAQLNPVPFTTLGRFWKLSWKLWLVLMFNHPDAVDFLYRCSLKHRWIQNSGCRWVIFFLDLPWPPREYFIRGRYKPQCQSSPWLPPTERCVQGSPVGCELFKGKAKLCTGFKEPRKSVKLFCCCCLCS